MPPVGLYQVCTLYNLTSEDDDDEAFDNCDKRIPYDCPVELDEKCFHTASILDFIYERHNDTYNLTRYEDDAELLDKI